MDVDPQTEVLTEEAEQVSRLLRTVERLRGERNTIRDERDTLRRNLDFLQVESKFSIEALQKKLQVVPATPPPTIEVVNNLPLQGPFNKHLERATLVSVLVAQHLQAQHDQDTTRHIKLVTTLAHAQERLTEAERCAVEREAVFVHMRREDVVMRDALTTAEVKLSSSESKMSDLTTLVSRLQEEVLEERAAHEETRVALSQAESQVADLTKSLDESESNRASLSLSITHLEQDLQTVKDDLASAEGRYTTLLSSTSSSAVTRALRDQIDELEARVLRRTEQIGVHQHELKRLETNMRLQEDRIAEMTGDLEIAESERQAMVEDCKNTREERDQAMKSCEELEERYENMEEMRDMEIQTLVGVVVDTVAKRRTVVCAMRDTMERYRARDTHLSSQLQNAVQTRDGILQEASQLRSEHSRTLTQWAETTSRLRIIEEIQHISQAEAQQATVALATLYRDLRGTSSALQSTQGSQFSVEQQLQALRTDLQSKLNELSALRVQYEALQSRDTERASEMADQREMHMAQVSELEGQCQQLKRAREELENSYQQVADELARAQDDIRIRASNASERVNAEEALRAELEETQRKYQVEADSLRSALGSAREQLEAAKVRQADTESQHRQRLEDVERAREELQAHLTEVLEKVEKGQQVEGDLEFMRERYKEEVEELKERLEVKVKTLEEVSRARDELVGEYARLVEEFEARKEEAVKVLREKEDLEMEIKEFRTHQTAELNILTQQLEGAGKEKEELQNTYSELEVRFDELCHSKEELEDQLNKMTADVDILRLELKSEMESRLGEARQHEEDLKAAKEQASRVDGDYIELVQAKEELESKLSRTIEEFDSVRVELQVAVGQRTREAQQHSNDLQAIKEQADKATNAQAELQEQVTELRRNLEEADCRLRDLQDEKQNLTTEMTSLNAEIQRLLSLQRFQEGRIHDGERDVASLKGQLERSHSDYVRSEKAAKSAEMKIELQTVQHEKALSTLRRELEVLQESSKLEEAVVELQEKNDEMEELLKAKCLEIEENDDRFIELLKEKKKLNSKIETLTRKVKILQDKLSAANSNDSTPKGNPLPTAPHINVCPARASSPGNA
ncbi:hypothetical protein EW026_g3655 [Hermanssonia centrifuga]|uniref:Uncharacterized protein n=1 Tax=Hermanssonia centrifuga TaxID=98765 RepID=A0A4S4KKN0_9APHY|nr:hypothetical protein EW026_g3655 [Hermanssonia centrifuga]